MPLKIHNPYKIVQMFEEEVAEKLGTILLEYYPTLLKLRYQLKDLNIDSILLLEAIAKKKSFSLKNHRIDLERAAAHLLSDYRQGLLGRISLESPTSRALTTDTKKITIDKKDTTDE